MNDDREVLEYLQDRVQEFVMYIQDTHPEDPRTRALTSKLTSVELLPQDAREGSKIMGKFKHSTGQLYVSPKDYYGNFRPEGSLNMTLVHEMAHGTRHKEPGETAHSPAWKQAFLWFLGIATHELGWDVDVSCSVCNFYGLCERSQCVKCNWLQNLCKPYTGGPKP